MKKFRKLATKLLITTMVLTSGMSATVYAMTTKEVTEKTPKSYIAGTNSIYGPKLSQDQLNAVAQATSDFMSREIVKYMPTDTKIKVAYNYIKNNTTYVDWNAVEGANTAYSLVTKKGACSGMSRSFKALCDAMGIECYYVHSTSNDHQWNLVRFGNGRLYHVDIDANKSAGKDVIYKSLTHPLKFDMSIYPAVGGMSSKPTGWKNLDKPVPGGTHILPVEHPRAKLNAQFGNNINTKTKMRSGVSCNVINSSTNTFKYTGKTSNLNPENLEISVIGFIETKYGMFALAPDSNPVTYTFKYDKPFSLDFNGKKLSAAALSKYCKKNNVIIKIEVADKTSDTALGQNMYVIYE
ncbi:transglutaminase domain-containing protein [Clostridioides sp. GD02377]|uniref:transglutaminase domain-containing protein n=1 Tax=unclassified Clostridioides TaxID=2635829 RepID=UPI0038A674AE